MKATLAPTPAKMAREMLAADRRAQNRRHRARRAHKVHTAPIIRPETFEPGIYETHHIEEARRQAFFSSSSAQPREADAAQPQIVGSVARHTCRAASNASSLDLLLAAILWGTALVCVCITLAIAACIALHLFGVE